MLKFGREMCFLDFQVKAIYKCIENFLYRIHLSWIFTDTWLGIVYHLNILLCCANDWCPLLSSSTIHFPQAKAAIRELLPNGLRESISKVRSSVAYAVSAIAHWDWPEAWPELFNLLMEMLVSGDLNAVHGAMRVLTGMWGLCHLNWVVLSTCFGASKPF